MLKTVYCRTIMYSHKQENSSLTKNTDSIDTPKTIEQLKKLDQIQAFEANLQSGRTIEIAKQKMIKNDRVLIEGIVASIANWLHRNFIEKQMGHDWTLLDTIKNDIEKKLKLMRETKPSLPNDLMNEKSQLRSVFNGTSLIPSISFGPTLPPGKYDEYYQFLNKGKKLIYFPVLIIVEPSGYGKTHFMIDCCINDGKLAIPFTQFFAESKTLITNINNKCNTRVEMELETDRYIAILLETLEYCSKDIPPEEFVALLMFNGILGTLAQYVDKLYATGYSSLRTKESFSNIFIFLDKAHNLQRYFKDRITRNDPLEPVGNAITLLSACCRTFAPVIVMSTQRTFDDYIENLVGGSIPWTITSDSLTSLSPIENKNIISYLSYFINTEKINDFDKIVIQQLLQGQMRYLEYFILNMCKEYNRDQQLSTRQYIRNSIARLYSSNVLTDELRRLSKQLEDKITTVELENKCKSEMLIVFGKLKLSATIDNQNKFEQYLQKYGIGYAMEIKHDALYYKDLIMSSKFQIANLSNEMIARWLVTFNSFVVRAMFGISIGHLYEVFLAIQVCKLFELFGCETKKSFFIVRDFQNMSQNTENELTLSSLLISEMKEKSNMNTYCQNLICLPADDKNGPDFITLCNLNTKEYICSASSSLESIEKFTSTNVKPIKDKIANDFMKTNPWFYWIAFDGLVRSKLDHLHFTNLQLDCFRLIFIPNIEISILLQLFEAANLNQLCANIRSHWSRLDFKEALYIPVQVKEIFDRDCVIDIIDDFTVETKRDRIIFVTKEHPFYTNVKLNALDKALLEIFLQFDTNERVRLVHHLSTVV